MINIIVSVQENRNMHQAYPSQFCTWKPSSRIPVWNKHIFPFSFHSLHASCFKSGVCSVFFIQLTECYPFLQDIVTVYFIIYDTSCF